MEKPLVYLRMKRKITARVGESITIEDVAYVAAEETLKKDIQTTKIYHVKHTDKQYAVIDSFKIIHLLQQIYPNMDCNHLGFSETIVHIEQKKHQMVILKLCLAWAILFVGTAMTIMNFHYDVNMQEVQQKLHLIFTGQESMFPLWIQIPYSIGLGIGMVLFLNHWFKRRFNEEPSPLEVELFTYQQDLDSYIAYYENELHLDDEQ
jgi:stage V sporulation protein AA